MEFTIFFEKLRERKRERERYDCALSLCIHDPTHFSHYSYTWDNDVSFGLLTQLINGQAG